jgi:Na+/melibiose symporter-like transporter
VAAQGLESTAERLPGVASAGVAVPRSLSPAFKACYGIGALTESIKSLTFGLFLLFFYTTVLGLSGTLVGLATALGLAWDAVIDPLIGYLSDRRGRRPGGRHAFMTGGALCMAVSFVAVFNPPAGLSTGALFAWLFVSSICVRTSNSAFMIPYYALGAQLSDAYDERTSIAAYRAAFTLGGNIVAATSALVFFLGGTGPAGADARFAAQGYSSMGVAFGMVTMTAGLITIIATRGLGASPRAAEAGGVNFLKTFVSALRARELRALIASASLFFLASVINASLALHYFTYYAGVTGTRSVGLLQLSFYAGALLGVPVWARTSRIAEKHRLYCAATLATASFMVAAYWLIGDGRFFGVGNLPVLASGSGLAGFFASALWVLAPSMLADVSGRDAAGTGQRNDGVVFGIFSFGQQAAAGIAILTSGVLIDAFAGLVPGQIDQSATTVHRIGLLYGVLPAALLVVAAGLILRYDLTRAEVDKLQGPAR